MKRVYNLEQKIMCWRTANLKGESSEAALAKPMSAIISDDQDRGHKVVEEKSVFIMRSELDGEGLGLFANKKLAKGTVVGQYVGELKGTQVLARHRSGKNVGSHYLSLRRYGLPFSKNTVDGSVHTSGEQSFGLDYFQRHGFSSLANCNIKQRCNCKIMVEYRSYPEFEPVFLDDEYCPRETPRLNRVTPPPTPHGATSTPHPPPSPSHQPPPPATPPTPPPPAIPAMIC
jgi:hypothetical protein